MWYIFYRWTIVKDIISEEEKLYRDGATCKVRLFLASLFTLESGSCTGIQSHAVIKQHNKEQIIGIWINANGRGR